MLRMSFLIMVMLLLASCATASNQPVGFGSNATNAVTERSQAHANLGAAYLQKNKLHASVFASVSM